jgi:carbon-monoxide dehydrogenase medium subunit
MFPAAFSYLSAHSIDEALASLLEHGADARVLAGGQSLIPAMRFRLARPGVLVDINPVGELN